ncbi:MAG: hypothetical protein J1F67_06005 [Muribaculaceae bacterium]|nr:hypothetical protein [Muribaculaceae bacterium]
MVNTLKVIRRANLQFFFVIVIVAALGIWQRMDAAKENSKSNDVISQSIKGLPVKDNSMYEPTEYQFGSDKKWNNYKKKIEAENVIYEGRGYISNHNVEVELFLTPQGQVAGRYHNENGTKLDLNGNVDASTGDLVIQLGHENNKTKSIWRLHPASTNIEDEIYEYDGTWGKKDLPSKLTLKRKAI